jgi:hypothetical protein
MALHDVLLGLHIAAGVAGLALGAHLVEPPEADA